MKKKKKSGTRQYLSGTKGRELDNKGMLTIQGMGVCTNRHVCILKRCACCKKGSTNLVMTKLYHVPKKVDQKTSKKGNLRT